MFFRRREEKRELNKICKTEVIKSTENRKLVCSTHKMIFVEIIWKMCEVFFSSSHIAKGFHLSSASPLTLIVVQILFTLNHFTRFFSSQTSTHFF